MLIRVRLFGTLADLAGRSAIEVEADGGSTTCASLRARLADMVPALAAHLEGCRFAVNHAFAPEGRAIVPGDEVALIGLVSGG